MGKIFSWRRTATLARHGVREALRQKLLAACAIPAAALVLGARGLAEFNFGASELRFLADLGAGAISLSAAGLAVATTLQLFLGDIEQRTVLTLLPRVSRAEYLVGKLAAAGVVVGVYVAVMELLLAVMLAVHPHAARGHLLSNVGWIAATSALLLGKCGVVISVTLAAASVAQSRMLAAAVAGAVFVAGHLHAVLAVVSRGDTGPVRTTVATAVHLLIPDLALFAADTFVRTTWSSIAACLGYAAAFSMGAVVLAHACWAHREV